ncbi:MAG TPA: sugar transferase [Thermomicrobiales bacterium]|nr:sugar transferase [Thermomicrobiales bacterium]
MSKRAFDIAIASFALVLCAPVMAAAAVALAFERSGPILRVTRRAGRHGRSFRLYRFRTMRDAAPGTPDAERVTRVGRFIRNSSLDELPMLVNVLKGDLSIVGPRPFPIEEVDVSDPDWQSLLAVRPGLISYAILTLNRGYNSASLARKLELEHEYARRSAFAFDLRIFARAVRALIGSRGNVKARGGG